MVDTLRVLIIENDAEDATRIIKELNSGGYGLVHRRVETAEEMNKALKDEDWNLIVAELELPQFSGIEAIKMYRDANLDIPFIVLSEDSNSIIATDLLEAGAHDFIMKSDLSRLSPVVDRELKHAKERIEHNNTEESLKEQALLFSTLFNNMSEGAGLVNIDEKFVYANQSLEEIFGVPQGGLIGRTVYEFLSNEGSEILQHQVTKRLKGIPSTYELEIQRDDGEIRHVLITAAPVFNEEKDVTKIFAIVYDITDWKLARKKLRQSEERFRTIAISVMDAIIMIDHEGNTSFWNPAAESIFGYTPKEIIGKNLHELIVPDEFLEKHKKEFARFIRTGEGNAVGKPQKMIAKRSDGSRFPVELLITSIEINNQWHAVGVIRDISEREQFEIQLRRSQKMESIGTLAAGIAHEINTPTQFVGNNIKFLEDGYNDVKGVLDLIYEMVKGDDDITIYREKKLALEKALDKADIHYMLDEIPNALSEAKKGIDDITRIVSAMRSFAHPGSKEKKMIDIHEVLESTITVSRNEWKYIAELETKFDHSIPQIPLLVGEFNQVILNLIINASHAIKDLFESIKTKDKSEIQDKHNGKIIITTQLVSNCVELTINDNGIGIPSKVQERIFEPFFTTKEVGKGTGQGLTLAHAVIVEQHGGEISFESEELKGTTFFLKLPVSEEN